MRNRHAAQTAHDQHRPSHGPTLVVSSAVRTYPDCPVGKGKGRPSKALTLAHAEAVLSTAEKSSMRGYIVIALLTGA